MDITTAEMERAKRCYLWSQSSWIEEIESDFPTLSLIPSPVVASCVAFFKSADKDLLILYGKAIGKAKNLLGAYFAGDPITDQEKSNF